MKKLLKLKEKVQSLHEEVAAKMNNEPVQYWRGGDWQIQGLCRAYLTVLKETEKLIS